MSNAMRKGSLLLILAAICAATLVGSPVRTHAATSDGSTSWTDDSPGGGTQNGDPDKLRFLQRIGDYRKTDLLDSRVPRAPLGCTILRAAQFWPLGTLSGQAGLAASPRSTTGLPGVLT